MTFMKLCGLSLETLYFEDYLSFLTEVLELELQELTDISMRLDLNQTWLEIKKAPVQGNQATSCIEFSLSAQEYEALKHKVSFFYYRKGPSRFLLLDVADDLCRLLDPDGRVWRFAAIELGRNISISEQNL
jgi:hypothetical protein